jgi:hypothetical protein
MIKRPEACSVKNEGRLSYHSSCYIEGTKCLFGRLHEKTLPCQQNLHVLSEKQTHNTIDEFLFIDLI